MAKILVVDDSRFMQVSLRSIIEKDGRHKVIGEAGDRETAISKYKELKPDLVTMDIVMPFESGLRAIKEIVRFDKDAKIIVISSLGQENIIEAATVIGAKGYIVKPVEAEKLLQAIDRVLGERQAE